jgi:hypothetical protein
LLLDTQTLLVVAIVVALVPGLMGALVWQSMRTYPGRWVLGNFLAALAMLLLRLHGTVPDWISILVANALATAAAIAFLQGIRQYRGLRIAWWPECLLGTLSIVALAYFRYATDNLNGRIFVESMTLGSIGIACAITLLKDMPRDRRTGLIVTGVVFSVGAAVHVLRAAITVTFAPAASLFDRSPSNTLFFLLMFATAITWSIGFIILTGERLATETQPALAEITPAHAALFQEIVPAEEVRQQLRRILESDGFRRSAQMERFLTLIVERSLLGRSEELKEYTLGRDVFHRGENYDPRADAIVRVEAQRLRKKLREYYESQGIGDLVIIDIPAGGYVPAFRYFHPGPITRIPDPPARSSASNG